MKSNLLTVGHRWKARGLAEGLAAGRAEGMAIGRAEGKAAGLAIGKGQALACLLVNRFGTLSSTSWKRIRGASEASIERWFNRALEADDLRSVFNRSRR